jgi:GAF domain-containing protein
MQAEADEYSESRNRALQLGYRTARGVPLVRAGRAVGVILIRRTEVCPFTERQIELLKTFAAQAVIAIENARLFEAEQARTRELSERSKELSESLEYQTAISNVLDIISHSRWPGATRHLASQISDAPHSRFHFESRVVHTAR